MATAALVAAEAANRASEAAARGVSRATGGQGGTVVLIAGVLFLGYLFLSRRLQRVAEVLRDPATASGSDRLAPPAVPGVSRPTYPAGAAADPTCWARTYSDALQAGRSQAQAVAAADAACGKGTPKLPPGVPMR